MEFEVWQRVDMESLWPGRIKRLPRYGMMPIPYFAFIKDDGVPDLRVLHPEHYRTALEQQLCGICGERLGRWLHFIGGLSIIERPVFSDLPMHRDCAEFALTACPFLTGALTDYSNRAYPEQTVMAKTRPTEIHPRINVLYQTGKFTITATQGMQVLIADKPSSLRYFQAGQEIKRTEVDNQLRRLRTAEGNQ